VPLASVKLPPPAPGSESRKPYLAASLASRTTARTRKPWESSSEHTHEPMKPLAPVTATVAPLERVGIFVVVVDVGGSTRRGRAHLLNLLKSHDRAEDAKRYQVPKRPTP
jgi:hypothetical protein